ncbi:histidine phosphatase family protein [Niabella insulamsoli]|uniref:histidine phosphatase family protein n=1 Tax=Niabella insulamsoli TaxID=3144874 RepID=UPI0031FD8763
MSDQQLLKVYLLRHGQTAWNADNNRYCGRSDIPLTDLGIEQAEQVREQLKNIHMDAVYASPLLRARTTAEIASNQKVVTDDRLIEADFGQWEQKTRAEFIAADPQSWEAWNRDPEIAKAGATGETGRQIVDRMNAFFNEMTDRHLGQTILVTAHNGVNRLYMAYKLGMPLRNYRQLVQHNSSITFFTLDAEGIFTLEHLNTKLK